MARLRTLANFSVQQNGNSWKDQRWTLTMMAGVGASHGPDNSVVGDLWPDVLTAQGVALILVGRG
jgi:hypothetical protein